MDPEVKQQLSKLVSVRLCPPVPGQILLDAVVDPPKPGDPSYDQFMAVSEGVDMKTRLGWGGVGFDEVGMKMRMGGWDGDDDKNDRMGWGLDEMGVKMRMG